MNRRADLVKLLENAGLLEPEAQALAEHVWRRRPRGRWQGEVSPWDVLESGWGALVVFLVAVLCIALWALIPYLE